MRQNEIPTDFCFLIFRPLLAGPWRLQGLEAPPQTLKALPLDPVTRELRGVVSLPSLALSSSSVSVHTTLLELARLNSQLIIPLPIQAVQTRKFKVNFYYSFSFINPINQFLKSSLATCLLSKQIPTYVIILQLDSCS